MKRFVIVDKTSLMILAEYRADSSRLGTGAVGGSWNDADVVMHLPVAPSMDGIMLSELQCVSEAEGILVDDCGCPMYEMQPMGDVMAYDASGEPILDSQKQQVKLTRFVSRPKLGAVTKIVRK